MPISYGLNGSFIDDSSVESSCLRMILEIATATWTVFVGDLPNEDPAA